MSCDNPACHNTQLMRTIPGGRAGIQVGQRWYCCADCFAVGSMPALAGLIRGNAGDERRQPRMSLGLMLVAKGFITASALRSAQKESGICNQSLESVLIRTGLVNERHLALARAAQWGYPLLNSDRVGTAVEADIPRTLLEDFMAAPFDYSAKAKRILLGFVYRVDHGLLESIEHITGCSVVPCFITATDWARQMEFVAAPHGYRSAVAEYDASEVRLSRSLGLHAVEVGARNAVFVQCGHIAWTRMTGKRGTMDLVLRAKNSSYTDHIANIPDSEKVPFYAA